MALTIPRMFCIDTVEYPVYCLILVTLYLTLCRALRYRRANAMLAAHSTARPMTVATAWSIHNDLITLEFPFTFSSATTYALFKAYGIPSISSLLVATQQLAGTAVVSSKRYADTGALLLEAVLNEPGSARSVEAWARINYLHDRHRGKSKGIKDEDMLYTLSLFALEPMRWVKRHEWRDLTPVEVCAIGTLWKHYGECLKISFELLSSHERGWKTSTEWIQDLDSWSMAYERCHMVPAESNHKLAESTLWILQHKVPKGLHTFARNMFAAAIDERLRKAMLCVFQSHVPFISQS